MMLLYLAESTVMKGGSPVGRILAQDSEDSYSSILQGGLSTRIQESDSFSAHPIKRVQHCITPQQQ